MAWQISAASVIGTKHIAHGRPCEDSHDFWCGDSSGVVVLAVADGAGSASLAQLGAKLAASTAVKVCRRRLLAVAIPDNAEDWKSLLEYAIHSVRGELERQLEEIQSDSPEHLPTTGSIRTSVHDSLPTDFNRAAINEGSKSADSDMQIGDFANKPQAQGSKPRHPSDSTVSIAERNVKDAENSLWDKFLQHLGLRRSQTKSQKRPEGKTPDGSVANHLLPKALTVSSTSENMLAKPLEANKAQSYETSRLRIGLRDLATTLLVAIVTDSHVAIVQIGDGVVVVRQNETYTAVTTPQKGEYINQTNFITSKDYFKTAEFYIRSRGEIDAITLMTDGLERLAINLASNVPHAPFFDRLFHFASQSDKTMLERNEALASALRSDEINLRTDDDKTLLVALIPKDREDISTPDSLSLNA